MVLNFFEKSYIETDKEVKEYILLERMEMENLNHEWILEYESHIGKIDYRDSLKEKYNELKKQV